MGMRIIIFDVDHGFCAFVRTPTRRSILIDCGCKTSFSPIVYLVEKEMRHCVSEGDFTFTNFILTHPHGDHLQDIDKLCEYPPKLITAVRAYDWEKVNEVNSSGGKADISTFTGMLGDYAYPADIVDYGCSVDVGYGLTPFEAESLNSSKMVNNSSRQVIVSHGGFKIVFSGDVEADGWGALLQNIGFRSALSGTNVFVASHHGHSSGYTKEIFNAMGKPDVVVVSAESGDPHVDGGYSDSKNVKGILYRDFGIRYMLSTRNDGSMVIDVSDDGRYTIELNDFPDNIFDDAGF